MVTGAGPHAARGEPGGRGTRRTGPGRETRRVEITLDLVCLHAYRGFVRLVRAAGRHRAKGARIDVDIRPCQIAPAAPYAGEPLFQVHKRAFGERAAREIRADTSLGVEDGLEVDLGRALFVNTFEAHRLLAQASAQGRGEQAAARLFRAYFAEGLNLADPAALTALAKETGVVRRDGGEAALRAELDRVRRLGVEAPPVFRFENGSVLEGEQPEETLYAALAR